MGSVNANTDASAPVFINFSNHPACNWSDAQKNAAQALVDGTIIDVPFPQVSASADEAEIVELARSCVRTICDYSPGVVMCQGEFGLTYQIITLLKEQGIRVVYSCSERKTIEKKMDNGTVKTSEFCFVRFRDY